MFKKALNGEYYNLKNFVKFSLKNDIWVGTLDVRIKIDKQVFIQKDFENINLDEYDYLKKIDDLLYVNFNFINMITNVDNKSLLMTTTTIKLKNIYKNYNITITDKQDYLDEILKGEEMWIKRNNNYFNKNNITNVQVNGDKIFINFKNNESYIKDNEEHIKPSFTIDGFKDEKELEEFLSEFTGDNWLQIENAYINLDNVYNIKFYDDAAFFNFTSNITKNINGRKIISTEFVKCECSQSNIKKLKEQLKITE